MDTKVSKSMFLKNDFELKNIGSAAVISVVAAVIMYFQSELMYSILLLAVGVFSGGFFFVKLNKNILLYEESLHNEVTATILSRYTHKRYAKYKIEYDVDGERITNKFRLQNRSAFDKKFRDSEEIEITVVPGNSKVFFIPEILNS